MRTDAKALTRFAHQGIAMFWFRQVMFIGATVITTAYLANPVPIACYLACLSAEVAEVNLGRRILREKELTQPIIQRLINWEIVAAGWSSIAVSAYGIIVAQMGEEAFLFVPLTYVFAASLYASIFNHQVKPVLITRLSIYVAGFLILGATGLFTSPPERQFLAFVIFFTTLSASFFFVINAIVFRMTYVERREREEALVERESRLLREIEDRRTAETARKSSDMRFRSLFEGAPISIREEDLSGMKRLIDALNLRDPEAFAAHLDAHPEFLDACAREIVVVDANRAALDQNGYADKSEMLAKVVRTLSPSAKKIVRMTATTINEGRGGASYETQITRADGEVRTVQATWSVLPGHEDSYARILLCSIDLTERLAAEDALRQAQKMEAVGQLTGGVAHDFNNLLTVISGNLDLMEATRELDGELSDPIRKAVGRGAELTQRLLAFSRKQPLTARAVDLSDLVSGMSAILQRSLGEAGRTVIDTRDDLWPVFADPGQVETALLNLTLNARDAMPEGGTVTFRCRNASIAPDNDLDLEPGDYGVLSVIDTGEGMTPEIIDHAFEPFFTTKEVGKGSGLGLSMVYGFVKQSGGTLQITSIPGTETTVSLYLPRANEDIKRAAQVSASQPVADGGGQTILVLEDDPDVRQYLIRLLKASGYRVQSAADGMAARAVLASGAAIDLLLSDIMLPGGMKGPDFAAELLARTPDVPVIFISGQPDEIKSASAEMLRNFHVIPKPFTRVELLDAIDASLSGKGWGARYSVSGFT